MIYFLLGLLAGVATPTQTSINGRFREINKSAFLTTVVCFAAATVVLLVICMFTDGGLAIPFGSLAHEPLWIWSGGFCGTVIVFMNTICLPKLGSANTVILVSFGQIMTSLVIDHFGLFSSPVFHMDASRAAGAVLVIAGVVLISYHHVSGDEARQPVGSSANIPSAIPYIAGALIGGEACGIQVAVNGTLAKLTESAAQTTLISMGLGLLSSLLVIAIIVLVKGKAGIFDEGERGGKYKWWMFTGGLIGVVVVLSNAVTAPALGTGLVTVLNLVGMMGGGLVIDATGFLGIEKKPVTFIKMLGMILMIGGTILISLI